MTFRTRQNPWRWLLPVLWGVALAAIAGIFACWRELHEQRLFPLGLYASALLALARAMDGSAPFGLALLLCLAPWHWGSRLPGWARVTARVLLPAGVLAVLAVVYRHELGRLAGLAAPSARAALLTAARESGPFLLTPAGLCVATAVLAAVSAGLLASRRSSPRVEAAIPTVARRVARVGMVLLFGVLRLILGLSAVAFLAAHLGAGASMARNAVLLRGRPNVIFIMLDTLRADHLGCYGYDLPLTPNLDRFARESTRFTHAVAQSSWTPWSVHSLMTSRYPDLLFPFTDLREGQVVLDSYFPTLPEILRNQGYATQGISSSPFLAAKYGAGQGYESFDDTLTLDPDTWNGATSAAVTDLAIARLARVAQRKTFLSLVYFDPHYPYLRHPGFDGGMSERMDVREPRRLAPRTIPRRMARRRDYHLAYNAEIGYTDFQVGRFLDALKEKGLYDDALIVVFSDHGEEFLEHGDILHKRTL